MDIDIAIGNAADVLAENIAEMCRIKTYGMSTYTVDIEEFHLRLMAKNAVTDTTGLSQTEINYIGQFLLTPYDN